MPLYVKDAKYFIEKLNQIEEISGNSLLVGYVISLCTNITNEGIKAVKEAYEKRPNKTFPTKLSEVCFYQ